MRLEHPPEQSIHIHALIGAGSCGPAVFCALGQVWGWCSTVQCCLPAVLAIVENLCRLSKSCRFATRFDSA